MNQTSQDHDGQQCAALRWLESDIPIEQVPVALLQPGESPRLKSESKARTVRPLAATVMPPIIVHRSTMGIVDGRARVAAARRRDQDTIAARFFEGSSTEEAFVLAVIANLTSHGRPLSRQDRNADAARILGMYPHWSDRMIAYDTPGSGTGGAGGNTTATPNGGSTLTAVGGAGGASSTSAVVSAGGSPGIESFDGQTYLGGLGGGAGFSTAGGNGTAPGGAGGGGSSFGFGGAGGAAGIWAAETIAIPSGMTEITGNVGAGGTGGASSSTEKGGTGAAGSAYFRFYSQAPS